QQASTNGHHSSAIEDSEEVELPVVQQISTNGHHSTIEDTEEIELSAIQQASTNGYHLYSIEDIQRVEIPSTEPPVATTVELKRKVRPWRPWNFIPYNWAVSRVELMRKFPATRMKNFFDKFPSLVAVSLVALV